MADEPWERYWARQPIAVDSDETLVAFVLDALGCAHEPVTRGPKPPRTDLERWQSPFCVTTTWRLETARCTIELDRTEDFFPADVNSAPLDHENFVVRGVRRDQTIRIEVRAHVGTHDLTVVFDGPPESHTQISAKFVAAFGVFG